MPKGPVPTASRDFRPSPPKRRETRGMSRRAEVPAAALRPTPPAPGQAPEAVLRNPPAPRLRTPSHGGKTSRFSTPQRFSAREKRERAGVPRGCTSRGGLLLRESQLREDERPLERGLVQGVVTARGAPVSRGHVRLQEELSRVGLQRPQACHVFRGLVVEDLAVVERRHDEHRGIRALLQVRVRAVRPDGVVILFLGGVSPFRFLAHRERQRRVAHRVGTSMNGTFATTAWKRSGRMFVTAPMRRPPALPPSMTRRSFAVIFCAMRDSAAEMKSENVFFFLSIFPSSCHFFPISPPPRMCAMATTAPRSRSGRRFEENVTANG